MSSKPVGNPNIQPHNAGSITQTNLPIDIYLSKDIVGYIGSQFEKCEDVIHLASTNKYLRCTILLHPPLWTFLLCKHFPSFYAKYKSKGQPDTESLSLYKQVTCTFRNMKEGECYRQIFADQLKKAFCMEITDDRKLIFSADKGRTIEIWDLETEKKIKTLIGAHQHSIQCMAITPDGKQLISGSRDGAIKIWDLATEQEIETKTLGQEGWIKCMAITPDGKQLISGSNFTIKIWDLETGKEIKTIVSPGGSRCMALTADGKQLIFGSWHKTIKILDLNTFDKPETLIYLDEDEITCMRIADGKCIFGSVDYMNATRNATIKIYDLDNWQEIKKLSGHEYRITCLEIIEDKQWLISASADMTIRIWDLSTGKELRRPEQSGALAYCVKFLDGKLISSAADGQIKIYNFNCPQVLENNLEILEEMANPECEYQPNVRVVEELAKDLPLEYQPNVRVVEELATDLPLLLVDFGIVTPQEYSQKLNCTPGHLSTIGICSQADLQALFNFNSPDFQYLKVEEVIDATANPQKVFYQKKKDILILLDRLFTAAQQKSNEIHQFSVHRDADGNVYDVIIPNDWGKFQDKLKKFKEIFINETDSTNNLLAKFKPESYANLVKELNALIDEFHALEQEPTIQFYKLYDYVNQVGVSQAWHQFHGHVPGIYSLSALLQQKEIAPQDIFKMG